MTFSLYISLVLEHVIQGKLFELIDLGCLVYDLLCQLALQVVDGGDILFKLCILVNPRFLSFD